MHGLLKSLILVKYKRDSCRRPSVKVCFAIASKVNILGGEGDFMSVTVENANNKVRNYLFFGLIALIIIIPVAGFVYKNHYDKVQVASSEKFEKVFDELKEFDELNLVSKKENVKDLITKLQSVIDSYPGSISAKRALFYKGYVSYYSEDYASAEKYLKEFVDNYKKMYLTGKAYYFLSYSYYESGKVDEALKSLTYIVDELKDSYYTPLALYRIAQIYEGKGDKEKAILNYKVVIDKYNTSSQSENAKKRLSMLENNVKF